MDDFEDFIPFDLSGANSTELHWLEPCVCGGTGDHVGQPVNTCDECDTDHPDFLPRKDE